MLTIALRRQTKLIKGFSMSSELENRILELENDAFEK